MIVYSYPICICISRLHFFLQSAIMTTKQQIVSFSSGNRRDKNDTVGELSRTCCQLVQVGSNTGLTLINLSAYPAKSYTELNSPTVSRMSRQGSMKYARMLKTGFPDVKFMLGLHNDLLNCIGMNVILTSLSYQQTIETSSIPSWRCRQIYCNPLLSFCLSSRLT